MSLPSVPPSLVDVAISDEMASTGCSYFVARNRAVDEVWRKFQLQIKYHHDIVVGLHPGSSEHLFAQNLESRRMESFALLSYVFGRVCRHFNFAVSDPKSPYKVKKKQRQYFQLFLALFWISYSEADLRRMLSDEQLKFLKFSLADLDDELKNELPTQKEIARVAGFPCGHSTRNQASSVAVKLPALRSILTDLGVLDLLKIGVERRMVPNT